MNHINLQPLTISHMIWKMKFPGLKGKDAKVVGSITNNVSVPKIPKMKACGLSVSSCEGSHIFKT